MGSLSVTQGQNGFTLCFWVKFLYIFNPGVWESYLAHLEFEKFSYEPPQGCLWVSPRDEMCFLYVFLLNSFNFYFRIMRMTSGTSWVWTFFIRVYPRGGGHKLSSLKSPQGYPAVVQCFKPLYPRELLHFHTATMFNSELQQNLYLLCKWTEVEYRIGTILVHFCGF